MKFIKTLAFLAFLSVPILSASPSIELLSAEKAEVEIQFNGMKPEGACTVWELQEVHVDFPGGYKPRSCWSFAEETDHYTDDTLYQYVQPYNAEWIVYGQLYLTDDSIVETNKIRLKW